MMKSELLKKQKNLARMSLKLESVVKTFLQGGEKLYVLKDINLEVERGEIVALTGPSGSGKTTLLQIAGLLDSPDCGNVFINSINLNNADDAARTRARMVNIGFVYQFHHLLPEFSALENVALPLLIQGKSKADALESAKNMLCEVGLSSRLHHNPSELSGGEQQRTAVARAIITKPKVILADEPTGNLDFSASAVVFDLMQKLVKSENLACLLVTHNLEIAKKCDRSLLTKDGSINAGIVKLL
jgi:lipoprotein-releasing system ATP-binding protein